MEGVELITLLGKGAYIPIKEIRFSVETVEELLTGLPSFERHQPRVQLIFVELNDRLWMIENAIEV